MRIIGWDLCKGAGAMAKPLNPGDEPGQILLYQAGPREEGDTAYEVDTPCELDIWRLDPRLTLIATFYHRVQPGRSPTTAPPIANLRVTVDARAIVHSGNASESPMELFSIPNLWPNGGNVGDGCEIASGMNGLRFRLGATIDNEPTDHDIVATLVAIPNVALGCLELAQDIIERLMVVLPSPVPIRHFNAG
jgi:hypothetical protein